MPLEGTQHIFQIKDVRLRIERARLCCAIQDDLSTKWGVDIAATGEHAGRKFRAFFGSADFFLKPLGALRHWRELDGTTEVWERSVDFKSGRLMPRLRVLRDEEVFKSITSLRHVTGVRFRFVCNARCNVFWYPDLTWDLPLTIDTPMTFYGVFGGRLEEKNAYLSKLSRVFDPTRFDYVKSEIHRGHRPMMAFRPIE